MKFSTTDSYVKCINDTPKAILRRTITSGDGSMPTDRKYMRYLIVGGGGDMVFGEAPIGTIWYAYKVGTSGGFLMEYLPDGKSFKALINTPEITEY